MSHLPEPRRIRVVVPAGQEPWDAHEKRAKIRYQGKIWHCFNMRMQSPPGTWVVELTETKEEPGDTIVDWNPKI